MTALFARVFFVGACLTSLLLLSLTFLILHHCHVQEKQPSRTTASAPISEELDPSTYTYTQYLIDFPGKVFNSPGEYARRQETFENNLMYIHEFNQEQQSSRGFVLGVNDLLDRFPEEISQMRGYDKSRNEAWQPASRDALSVSELSTGESSGRSRYQMKYLEEIEKEPTAGELPTHVDWRTDSKTGRPLATPVKSQGHCGSCWAFASTAALETHISLASQDNLLTSLSVQELVSCVPNPNHCGGNGGCGGSTAELAYDYIAKHGLVDEWRFGYQNFDNSHQIQCTLKHPGSDNDSLVLGNRSNFFKGAVATLDGFVKLPSNNYTALMHTVAKFGPVVVNVAADNWRFYEKGVFSDHGHSVARTDINHVVVLMGYGTDADTGEDYWLVRNSYGPFWGEGGYIRLKRLDPITLVQPDADCGMDVRPADGIGCTKGDNGTRVEPPAVKVCGTSGVLFDPVLPIGARILENSRQNYKRSS